MKEIGTLTNRLNELAKWHEAQCDALPWAGGRGHSKKAIEHNRFANTAYEAAILINEQLVEDK